MKAKGKKKLKSTKKQGLGTKDANTSNVPLDDGPSMSTISKKNTQSPIPAMSTRSKKA